MKECPRCGEMVGDGLEHCYKCGYLFDMSKPMITSGAFKVIAWVVFGLLIALGVLIGFLGIPSTYFTGYTFNFAGMIGMWITALVLWLSCAVISSILHHLEKMHK
ncbi:MAG: hypothetical protein ACOX6U_05510 [Oscillospiraceae bacterium]|jgi:hypothetical protein